MANHSHFPDWTALVLGVSILVAWFFYNQNRKKPYANIPVLSSDRNEYLQDGRGLLERGKKFKSCFQVQTGTNFKIVVPNRFATELKNHQSLSFNDAHARDSFTSYPGLQPFREILENDTFIQEVVRKKLTGSLGLITTALVEETQLTYHDMFGESKEWQTRVIKSDIQDIIARLSSRVFLGHDLCRNRDWLDITKNYTLTSFQAISELRAHHSLVRPVMHWFSKNCTQARHYYKRAQALIKPVVDRRKAQIQTNSSGGEGSYKTSDAIGWMVECARGRNIDYAAAQLSFSLAAIHLSSETMTMCMLQLCDTPELIEPLREDCNRALDAKGWTKQALQDMKLLDSFMRECQRMRDLLATSMLRFVKAQVVLSDGTVIPKGSTLMVVNDWAHSSEHFPNADTFDMSRFVKLRERTGEENQHLFSTPSADQMGFGFGEHACPGRFFASNEIKIALCILLLEYDFEYVPGDDPPQDIKSEIVRLSDPGARMRIRKREGTS
ncbi:cytochrome P450 [Lophiostoma macrostomum CBS 122681]|uniref:Cytochrome P450 n=1 Tax=Lophiostoma macrostomum CBS 122681 TaxID=1314788 RepID=A0A6A6T661_9PLEO|nr:cytochrome P450 [Lophiostoma macrostomum CBS 122681]